MPNAASLYYYTSSNGNRSYPPLVLIHGAGGSHLYWPSEIRRLPNFRTLALDLPGHGKSTGHGLQTIAAYSDRIIEWMNAIKLHRAIFIGHSMGGAIALQLALNHPERTLGLGLIGTGAKLPVDPLILDNTLNPQTYPSAIATIVAKSFSPAADPHLVDLAQNRYEKTRRSVLHGDLLACNVFDRAANLPALKTPTLVVCGQHDELTPPRYSQFLADQIPNAVLRIIPDAGHMVMLEKPQEMAAILVKQLAEIPYNPGLVLQKSVT
jgi:pimeloyl-ACP methyl ester carboxylesterase